jgi:hypothetical protein
LVIITPESTPKLRVCDALGSIGVPFEFDAEEVELEELEEYDDDPQVAE